MTLWICLLAFRRSSPARVRYLNMWGAMLAWDLVLTKIIAWIRQRRQQHRSPEIVSMWWQQAIATMNWLCIRLVLGGQTFGNRLKEDNLIINKLPGTNLWSTPSQHSGAGWSGIPARGESVLGEGEKVDIKEVEEIGTTHVLKSNQTQTFELWSSFKLHLSFKF